MEILFSVLIGGGFGALWALAELAVFFRGLKKAEHKAALLKAADDADNVAAEKQKTNYVMKYFVCKYVLNIVLLLVIFLLRAYLPYRWEYIMLSAGIVMALTSQLVFVRFASRK